MQNASETVAPTRVSPSIGAEYAAIGDVMPASKFGRFDPLRHPCAQRVTMDNLRTDGPEPQAVVTVRQPHKEAFVRVHPDVEYHAHNLPTVKDSRTRQIYLIDPELEIAVPLQGTITYLNLATAITREGHVFLWSYANVIGAEANFERNAQYRAMRTWLRVRRSNPSSEGRLEKLLIAQEEPLWPELTLSQLLELAFKGRVIDSRSHALLR